MPGRIFTVLLLAMGALCCPFRCLHHQADCVAFFVFSGENEQVVPPSPPAEQNESGCICRGAVFIEAPTLTPVDQMHWCPLVQDCVQVADAFQLESPGAFISPSDHSWRIPLSGKALRTWHGSFLF